MTKKKFIGGWVTFCDVCDKPPLPPSVHLQGNAKTFSMDKNTTSYKWREIIIKDRLGDRIGLNNTDKQKNSTSTVTLHLCPKHTKNTTEILKLIKDRLNQIAVMRKI